MPRTFDNIASGGDLSNKLLIVVPKLQEYLQKSRKSGAITPEHPIHGRALGKRFEITDVEVRAVVSYLRERDTPIASTSKGYFYAIHIEELTTTFQQLCDRRDRLNIVLEGLTRAAVALP